MRVEILQHVPYEGIGSIAAWLRAREAEVAWTRLWRGDTVPDLAGRDLVVAMGGPMSAGDTDRLPWLREEKARLREAVERGQAVLGICLGAQLIASALGAAIERNPDREIGWFPVEAIPAVADTFAFPPRFTAFHWHGETFTLPPGAVHLARSAACERQAFQVGRRTLGLQFHLENTPESAAAIIEHSGPLPQGPWVQTSIQMHAAAPATFAALATLLTGVLDYLVA
jgi:GMP synthase-like glutamine amidotransferase